MAARKQQLRVALRRRRAALTPAQRHLAARSAAHHLLRCPALRRVRRVAIYLSHGHELDTAPLLRALHERGLQVYTPVILSSQCMCFVRLRPHDKLRRGPFGVRQPVTRRPRCAVRHLQMILLPLLGFDAQGRRLGQGGGYYDRALADRRDRRQPLRVGYAYAVQEAPVIPSEPWDLDLHALASEDGFRRFRG